MEKLINLKTTALRAWNTSGLPNNIDEKEQVLGDGDENRNWEMVRKLPMEFSPGDKFSYNQTGYYILGRIITKLSGQHFTKFIEENQFRPCGMVSTRFGDSNDVIPHIQTRIPRFTMMVESGSMTVSCIMPMPLFLCFSELQPGLFRHPRIWPNGLLHFKAKDC
ncbi:serine hydrolase domain-containing protein [uncultured Chryseobacterium sp.]|uniref:serine hydrolase n=1 Tax=uncultured Chryseobacterium sp. TaxID=259322 RepID=UPI0025CBC30D|nr:serine hydrolase domain-containing protein [uncultured Chryseobacterium sp.]